MKVKALKYLAVFSLPTLVIVSFLKEGFYVWLPVIEVFVLIPLLELFFKPNEENLSETEEEVLKKDVLYDWMVYATVPIQYALLVFFLFTISQTQQLNEILGRTVAMGLLCGVFGINVGHELGHRSNKGEQFLAKALLLSSLYLHFFIEHNRGHHKNVSTPDDPATARKGELLYFFWLRSIVMSYISAWKIQTDSLKKKKLSFFSSKNEMLIMQIAQIGLLISIAIFFGLKTMLLFMIAAFIGILLLETVNYIEHYGLLRQKQKDRYEMVQPHHSWNSDHVVGRIMLFELSRHSDHHFKANRKYQVLRHMEDTPQMPTGYPGMILLALVPPVWFWIMNRQIQKLQTH
ncbi:MAG: alkane 1-monooxygenase [Bacteroidota bacterium]